MPSSVDLRRNRIVDLLQLWEAYASEGAEPWSDHVEMRPVLNALWLADEAARAGDEAEERRWIVEAEMEAEALCEGLVPGPVAVQVRVGRITATTALGCLLLLIFRRNRER